MPFKTGFTKKEYEGWSSRSSLAFSYFHTFRTMGYLKNTWRIKSILATTKGKKSNFEPA